MNKQITNKYIKENRIDTCWKVFLWILFIILSIIMTAPYWYHKKAKIQLDNYNQINEIADTYNKIRNSIINSDNENLKKLFIDNFDKYFSNNLSVNSFNEFIKNINNKSIIFDKNEIIKKLDNEIQTSNFSNELTFLKNDFINKINFYNFASKDLYISIVILFWLGIFFFPIWICIVLRYDNNIVNYFYTFVNLIYILPHRFMWVNIP